MSIKTVLVIGAHHDDNELVGGTLIKYVKAGWRVVSVVMTDGKFSDGKASDKNIAIREKESLAAAKVLGIECVFLHFSEGDFQPTDQARKTLLEQIRRYTPKIVITHPPKDYHIDHMNVSKVTHDAILQVFNPCIKTESAPCETPKLYYCDAWFIPFVPVEYVDISDLIDLKGNALRCHKSQLNIGTDKEEVMIDMSLNSDRARGIEAGVRYAEAFRLEPNLGTVRLSKCLGVS
jgi:N-acetylglucosamine malate deacetylase 1